MTVPREGVPTVVSAGDSPGPERYHPLPQVGAGSDGVSYRAQVRGTEGLVEVRVLAAARADEARWGPLARRLGRARLLDHPAAARVLAAELDAPLPFLVLEWVDGPT